MDEHEPISEHELLRLRKRYHPNSPQWECSSPEVTQLIGVIYRALEEIGRLRKVNESDRTTVAIGVEAILAVLASRGWMVEGRGSYEYDDERYQKEFGEALGEIREVLSKLRIIGADLSDCPTNQLEIDLARGKRGAPVFPSERDVMASPERARELLAALEEEEKPKLVGEYMGIKIFSSKKVPPDELWGMDAVRKRVYRVMSGIVRGGVR